MEVEEPSLNLDLPRNLFVIKTRFYFWSSICSDGLS